MVGFISLYQLAALTPMNHVAHHLGYSKDARSWHIDL